MIRLVRDSLVGSIPFWLSEQVGDTIDQHGYGSGLIHLALCFLLIEAGLHFIKGFKNDR